MTLFELIFVVVFTGIIVVFSALLILTFVTDIYGKIFNKIKLTLKKEPKLVSSKKHIRQKQDDDISPEIIAAISSAVYIYGIYSEHKYKIKSISPHKTPAFSSWKLAGLLENMYNKFQF